MFNVSFCAANFQIHLTAVQTAKKAIHNNFGRLLTLGVKKSEQIVATTTKCQTMSCAAKRRQIFTLDFVGSIFCFGIGFVLTDCLIALRTYRSTYSFYYSVNENFDAFHLYSAQTFILAIVRCC